MKNSGISPSHLVCASYEPMIKIFRNIRQNLLSEEKTGKYFKYAIGEIFLVVIGILIALHKIKETKTTNDYQGKVTSYVNTYTFGVTKIHDQGALIDSLIWNNIDHRHLAATFQGISNFKRILFTETKEELEYYLESSQDLIKQIDHYLKENYN